MSFKYSCLKPSRDRLSLFFQASQKKHWNFQEQHHQGQWEDLTASIAHIHKRIQRQCKHNAPLWGDTVCAHRHYLPGLPGSSDGNLPAMQEIQVQSLDWEAPLQKRMAVHSSILAWRIPWTEEPGRLHSMGCKESDTTEQLHIIYLCSHHSRPCRPQSQRPHVSHLRIPKP